MGTTLRNRGQEIDLAPIVLSVRSCVSGGEQCKGQSRSIIHDREAPFRLWACSVWPAGWECTWVCRMSEF